MKKALLVLTILSTTWFGCTKSKSVNFTCTCIGHATTAEGFTGNATLTTTTQLPTTLTQTEAEATCKGQTQGTGSTGWTWYKVPGNDTGYITHSDVGNGNTIITCDL